MLASIRIWHHTTCNLELQYDGRTRKREREKPISQRKEGRTNNGGGNTLDSREKEEEETEDVGCGSVPRRCDGGGPNLHLHIRGNHGGFSLPGKVTTWLAYWISVDDIEVELMLLHIILLPTTSIQFSSTRKGSINVVAWGGEATAPVAPPGQLQVLLPPSSVAANCLVVRLVTYVGRRI